MDPDSPGQSFESLPPARYLKEVNPSGVILPNYSRTNQDDIREMGSRTWEVAVTLPCRIWLYAVWQSIRTAKGYQKHCLSEKQLRSGG